MINQNTREVLMVKKNRPAWQAGLWNGIGGKIGDHYPDETPVQAQVREFREECGIETRESAWEHTITMAGEDSRGDFFSIYYFRTFVTEFPPFQTMTDEVIDIVAFKHFHYVPTLDNMKWILPMVFCRNIRTPLHIQWKPYPKV